MVRPDKATAVAELASAFRDSSAAVLTEYRGLTVAELKALRRSLAGNATYAVVKNTLTKIAAREAGIDAFDALLEGPSAIAFVSGDPVDVAKGLRNFGREHPHLVVKGGILDGKALTADEIRRLADLESREVLLAMFAGGLVAPARQLVSVLAAPMTQLARLLAALEAKLAADPSSVAAPGVDQPDAAEPEAPAAAAPEAPTAAEIDGASAATADADVDAAASEPADAPSQAEPAATDLTPTDPTPTDEPPADDADADAPADH
jgi:large subunit ribosomal protein L10